MKIYFQKIVQVSHPEVQRKAQREIDENIGKRVSILYFNLISYSISFAYLTFYFRASKWKIRSCCHTATQSFR